MSSTTDGRLLRGERTRSNIVQSLLDLVTDGVRSPTAAQIAQHAGVSVRSVFQHFDDLERLYGDLVVEQAQRVAPIVAGLRTGGELGERIAAVVDQRQALFETITPVRRAIADRPERSPVLRERLEALDSELRTQLQQQFRAELADRPEVLEAIDVLASFEVWHRLRTAQRLSSDEAADTLRESLSRILH